MIEIEINHISDNFGLFNEFFLCWRVPSFRNNSAGHPLHTAKFMESGELQRQCNRMEQHGRRGLIYALVRLYALLRFQYNRIERYGHLLLQFDNRGWMHYAGVGG